MSEPDFQPESLQPENKKDLIRLGILGLVIALVAVSFLGYQYYKRFQLIQSNEKTDQSTSSAITENIKGEDARKKAVLSNLKGKLYLTLSPIDSTEFGIFSYNFATEKMEKLLSEEGKAVISGQISPGGKYITVSNGNQIYLLETEDLSRGLQLTNDEIQRKTEPVWGISKDVIVYYSAQKDIKTAMNRPNNWQIYSIDEGGEEIFITDGIHPHITHDNQFLIFLKNDGVYALDLDKDTPVKIWEMATGKAITNMHINISPFDQLIAWSSPKEGKVFLMKADYGKGFFKGEIIKEIDAHAFWPTFSPDGRYLMLEEVDWGDENLNPRLVVYDLKNYRKTVVLDLTDYKQGSIQLTDWK
ncbi:MAG: hypothetical protein KAV41_00345 [Candidatus Pacebacteria bacterium]|nr:hypothetical protein [Candidatus Paceibacterota bacterium]